MLEIIEIKVHIFSNVLLTCSALFFEVDRGYQMNLFGTTQPTLETCALFSTILQTRRWLCEGSMAACMMIILQRWLKYDQPEEVDAGSEREDDNAHDDDEVRDGVETATDGNLYSFVTLYDPPS